LEIEEEGILQDSLDLSKIMWKLGDILVNLRQDLVTKMVSDGHANFLKR
jgi:hypothetical protein